MTSKTNRLLTYIKEINLTFCKFVCIFAPLDEIF